MRLKYNETLNGEGGEGAAALTVIPPSSMAAIGLLMLLTNLLTCSKCLVISVASTMSMMACRSVRNWFLSEAKREESQSRGVGEGVGVHETPPKASEQNLRGSEKNK